MINLGDLITNKKFDLYKFEKDLIAKYGDEDVSVEIHRINREDIVFDFASQLKCLHCGQFGRTYRCPPKVPPFWVVKESLKKYNYIALIIARVDTKKWDAIHAEKPYGEYKKKLFAGTNATAVVKSRVNNAIQDYEKEFKRFGIKNRLFEGGGGCRKCRVCKMKLGEPCKYPQESFSAPEALGISSYDMLPLLGIKLQQPPQDHYLNVGIVCANLKDYDEPKTQISRPILANPKFSLLRRFHPLEREFDFHPLEVKNATEYFDKRRLVDLRHICEECGMYSDIICNTKYIDWKSLEQWIQGKKLLIFRLKYQANLKKGMSEGYSDILLPILRAGYWWAFAFADKRCNACGDKCSHEYHITEGFKNTSNRRIVRCLKTFGIFLPEELEHPNNYYIIV